MLYPSQSFMFNNSFKATVIMHIRMMSFLSSELVTNATIYMNISCAKISVSTPLMIFIDINYGLRTAIETFTFGMLGLKAIVLIPISMMTFFSCEIIANVFPNTSFAKGSMYTTLTISSYRN